MTADYTDRVVPGISVTPSGQASVDPSMSDVLFDLALKLEEPSDLPVDIEHVLAAIVLAARQGALDPETPLSAEDPTLVDTLLPHVRTIFEKYNGTVGDDD